VEAVSHAAFVRITGTAPQSVEEVVPLVRAMRQSLNDELLGLQWNPEAVITRYGSFDAFGQGTAPVYEGRWEVIRFSADPPLVVTRLADPVTKAYRPVGWWLLEFLQQWDRQNAHWMEAQKRLVDEAEAERAADDALRAASAEQEVEIVSRRLGGEKYMGRGFAIEGDRAVTGTPRSLITLVSR
jgi:hypothetical protein